MPEENDVVVEDAPESETTGESTSGEVAAADEAAVAAEDAAAEVDTPTVEEAAVAEEAPAADQVEDAPESDRPPKIKRPTAPLLVWIPLIIFGVVVAGGGLVLIGSMIIHAGALLYATGIAVLVVDGLARTLVWVKWRSKLEKTMLIQGVQSLIISAFLAFGGYAHTTLMTIAVSAVGINLLVRGAVAFRAGAVRRYDVDSAERTADEFDESDDSIAS